jgi:hypothetical protein
MEELPDSVPLRKAASEPTESEAAEPKFDTPSNKKHGLSIITDEDEEGDEDSSVSAKMTELTEQVDNPYLLHYKKKSETLQREVFGGQNVPITPCADAKRDPEEEFFMLAVLALKMLHNEQYEDAEYVYEVSAAKLFK